MDHITPYDRFAWSDLEAEALLRSGAHAPELAAYFGAAEYRTLRRLAVRAATAAPSSAAPHVIIVPGMMGTQLGLRRPAPLPSDVVWLDPVDIQLGRLAEMGLDSGAPIVPLGAVLYGHMRLKLALACAGFSVSLYAYDWRRDIATLGTELAAAIKVKTAGPVALVGHSMGGLLCRAALACAGAERVSRVVLLGAPNGGSYAPLQALRGTYPLVRRIACLDTRRSAEELASQVFSSFPSLYQMLPRKRAARDPDLFDAAAWPDTGPQPRRDLLHAACELDARLVAADARFAVIAGIAQETVTAVHSRRDGFRYTVSRRGDGTVPQERAHLPGAAALDLPVAHSELTRDERAIRSVITILHSGRVPRLRAPPSRSRATAQISEGALRRTHIDKIDWARLGPEQRQRFLQSLNEPPHWRLRTPRTPGRAPRRRRTRVRRGCE